MNYREFQNCSIGVVIERSPCTREALGVNSWSGQQLIQSYYLWALL